MWWIWQTDGWGLLYSVPVLTLWIVWHGWQAEYRHKNVFHPLHRSCFAVEIPFRIFMTLGYYSIFRWLVSFNPPLWDQSITSNHVSFNWVHVVVLKELVCAYFLLLAVYVALGLRVVRQSLGLSIHPAHRYTSLIYTYTIIAGLAYWITHGMIDYFLFNPESKTFINILAFNIRAHDIFMRTFFEVFLLICAIVIARIVRYKVIAEAGLERLMLAIDHVDETVIITDADAKIEYANSAFERITGYTREEAIGENPRILQSGKHDDTFYKDMWDTLERGETWTGRFFNKKKDGSLYTEDANISPVLDHSGKTIHYVAVKHDVTRKLKMENDLHQAQKMESVGQLAGGVAHDFNNILQVILGNVEMQLNKIPDVTSEQVFLKDIQGAAERAAELTSQLLAFGQRQVIEPIDLNLNKLIINLFRMIRRIIGEHITIDFIPEDNLNIIQADRNQIEMILINLSVNARDAMPNGGILTLETSNIIINSEQKETFRDIKPGSYVVLSVSDTGCGIEKEIIDKIFEPFFTTKEVNKGTGMGLASVYGIARQHSGHINVISKVGEGTTFKIYLPQKKLNPGKANHD